MALGEYLGAGSGTTKLLLHLNGNSNDSSGNGNNGTDTNISYVGGKIASRAASFNGTTGTGASRIELPNVGAFDLTTGTWRFWVKLNSTTAGFTTIFDHRDETTGSGNYAGFKINHYTDGINKFRTEVIISNGSSGNQTINRVDYGVSDTQFHLVTITLSGTTTKIYFDGDFKSTKTDHSSVNYSTSPRIFLGASFHEYTPNGTYSEVLNGLIDEVIIENRVIIAEEEKKYYTYTKGRFGIV